MKKIFIVNILIGSLGIILYLILTFFVPLELGTGHKELENIILLAMPCFLIFILSFTLNEERDRRRCLNFYLVSYFIVMLGFVFSNNRYSELIFQGIMPREYNLIPFHSIIELLKSPLGFRFAFYNIIGNFFMLTPLSILLPMINQKFKKTKVFFLSIISLCFFIESVQYITGLGSFDIDDFILNISGAMLIYIFIKLSIIFSFLEQFFLKKKFSNTICVILYSILLIIFILVCIRRIVFLVNDYYANEIDLSDLKCQTEEKTYLGDVGNYHYYSKCDYGTTYITVGNQKYKMEDFIHSRYLEDYINQLQLEKEEIVTNVFLEKKNSNKTLLYYDSELDKNYYLYGYQKIYIEKDGQVYNLKEMINQDELNIGSVLSLAELKYINPNQEYSISSGKYYQILSCSSRWSFSGDVYILDLDFEITENSCSLLERNE